MQSKDAKGSRALLPEQDRHHFTKEGTVTPEDHRVVVDHKVPPHPFLAPIPPHTIHRRPVSSNSAHSTGAWRTASSTSAFLLSPSNRTTTHPEQKAVRPLLLSPTLCSSLPDYAEHESEEPHSLKDGPDPPPGSLFEQVRPLLPPCLSHTNTTTGRHLRQRHHRPRHHPRHLLARRHARPRVPPHRILGNRTETYRRAC